MAGALVAAAAPGRVLIDGDLVLCLLEDEGLAPEAPPATVVAFARADGRKMLPTLLSAWRTEGRAFSSPLEVELDLHARRRETYERLADELLAIAPVKMLRGLGIARLYPPGLVRQLNDLDCLLPTNAELWAVARRLVATGWTVMTLTLLRVEGELCAMLRLERPAPDPFLIEPEAVELATVGLVGDLWSVPSRRLVGLRELGTPPGDVLMLAAEGLERPYHARDVLDAVLLLEALDERDLGRVRAELERYELWRPWLALARRLRSLDLVPRGRESLTIGGEPREASLRRARHVGRRLLRPGLAAVAYGQRALTTGRGGPLGRAAQASIHRLASPDRVLAAGLPVFGLQVDGPATDGDEIRLDRAGALLVADTPVGRFAFVAAEVVREEWLEALA